MVETRVMFSIMKMRRVVKKKHIKDVTSPVVIYTPGEVASGSQRKGKQNLVESRPLHLASAGYLPLSCNSRLTG